MPMEFLFLWTWAAALRDDELELTAGCRPLEEAFKLLEKPLNFG